jgi:hypothetical protein
MTSIFLAGKVIMTEQATKEGTGCLHEAGTCVLSENASADGDTKRLTSAHHLTGERGERLSLDVGSGT